jgi:membrane protein YdbS with pleckstrin-like domain
MRIHFKSKESKSGLGLGTFLLILFIILKLTGIIEWKWIWVLSPLWISLAFGILVLLIVGIAFLFGITMITKQIQD